MARKQPQDDDQEAVEQAGQTAGNFAVPQGNAEDHPVGYGNPPKEYQFKPGESGNPDGSPKHRTNLWVWFTKYMNMTDAESAGLDAAQLTQAQQTARSLVEKVKAGEKVGSTIMARYIVDREEGKAAEHLILDNGAELSHEECEEIRKQMRERFETNAGQRSKPA
ncbi:MAG: hypothetical protein NTZ17_06795 [Phycisphaerae bacterium]|nr:hypothetical protein [Phycisphaerae bacterium]